MRVVLLLLLIFPSLNLRAGEFDGYYFQSGCLIHNLQGAIIRNFPGDMCLFLDDGSYISASDHTLRFIAPDMTVKWVLNIPVHHQINFSNDKKRILVLSSDFLSVGNKRVRDDRFMVVSMDGVILHQKTIAELVPAKDLLNITIVNSFSIWGGVAIERSHFNSFHEIPEVPERASAPWLKSGNFIVNSIQLGILILPPDLSKVIHQFTFPHSSGHQIHDAQILSSGNLLLFNNSTSDTTDLIEYSSVDEADPVSFEMKFRVKSTPEQHFHAGSRSGVQSLNDEYVVFSLEWLGVYVVSRKTGKVVLSNFLVNVGNGYLSNQNVRMLKLSGFLSNKQN